ncbi:MAG: hypothetical protein ACREDL_17435 [Bradyrhizobium sp.]
MLEKAYWGRLGPSNKVPGRCKVVNVSRKAAPSMHNAFSAGWLLWEGGQQRSSAKF